MKSMLDAITLNTIYKILSEKTQIKLSPAAQILYIRCLISHFKDLDCIEENSFQFDMFEEDFPNYNKWKKALQELHKAKLVQIGSVSISFVNHWGMYIDREIFENKNDENIHTGFSIEKFKESMIESRNLFELCCMKYKITFEQVRKLLDLFIQEQEAIKQKYRDENSCNKHFINWIPFHLDKIKTTKKTTKILGSE